jgi:hypothetical protein
MENKVLNYIKEQAISAMAKDESIESVFGDEQTFYNVCRAVGMESRADNEYSLSDLSQKIWRMQYENKINDNDFMNNLFVRGSLRTAGVKNPFYQTIKDIDNGKIVPVTKNENNENKDSLDKKDSFKVEPADKKTIDEYVAADAALTKPENVGAVTNAPAAITNNAANVKTDNAIQTPSNYWSKYRESQGYDLARENQVPPKKKSFFDKIKKNAKRIVAACVLGLGLFVGGIGLRGCDTPQKIVTIEKEEPTVRPPVRPPVRPTDEYPYTTIEEQAGMKPGDIIKREDGTLWVATQGDIDAARRQMKWRELGLAPKEGWGRYSTASSSQDQDQGKEL